jgi:hypothetical protein
MAITLVSENTSGNSGNSDSGTFSPGGRAVSADGRYVVYYSLASDLVAGDINNKYDIFVYDTVAQTTTLISNDASGGPANGHSYDPSISGDGRYVVYHSTATDLVTDGNSSYNIYLYDTVSQTTKLISRDSSGNPSNGTNYPPSISADGRYVVYDSTDSNLVTGDTNNARDIFLYDTVSETTTLISNDASGGPSNGYSFSPSVSADGHYVVYYSSASDLVTDITNSVYNIYLYDTVSQTTTLISWDSSGNPSNGHSYRPSISADGRYVVFRSLASNLVEGDANGSVADIFVHDTLTGTTELVTLDTLGGGASSASDDPSISGDGKTILFQSYASDLVTNDTNGLWDVFLADNPLLGDTIATANTDALSGNADDNSVFFSAATLTNGDSYDGLGGTDTVMLAGGGIFDFTNTTFTSIEDIQTDGSNTIFGFAGFGSSESDREGMAGLISSAAGTADSVQMGEWNYDLTLLDSLFDAGIETVEWSRPNGFDYSAVRNGSGQTVVTKSDSGGNRTYDTIDQTFDPNGILRESATTYDDGRVATSTYNSGGGMTGLTITDPLNAANYDTIVNVYSGGLLQSSSLTFDNGNTSTKTYTAGVLTQTVETDVADDFTWDVKTTTYNSSGVKTGYVVDYDAGEARSQMSFAYTGGILTNRTITNSDGSASEASYNTSGEMQYVRNTASDGTQFILGGTGDNTLTGGTLDDIFKGGTGNDIFDFEGTVGNDTILDFTDGQDRLDLSAYGYTTLADLQNANAISEVNGDTVIDLGPDGSVTLTGFALTDFGDADLIGLPVI